MSDKQFKYPAEVREYFKQRQRKYRMKKANVLAAKHDTLASSNPEKPSKVLKEVLAIE